MTGPLITKHEVTSPAQVIGSPGFVGRERELAALSEALAHGPAVVLIEGEAGIGKSTLLREYLASSGEGQRALVAHCPPFRQPHTLGPVADAVRQATDRVTRLPLSALSGALRPLFPEWADDLSPSPEPAEDPTAARHRLFRSLAELVSCLRLNLLVVEDAQWADEATIEFLLFLATPQRMRVSLVVTYRPEDVPAGSLLLRLSSRRPAGATQLRLAVGPLDVAATARMVSSMLAVEQIPAQFAEFMYKRTEGVPLAVEELVRLLGDRADLARRHGAWVRRHLDKIDVPPTIRDAVVERLQRLSPAAQAVLHTAAVLAEPTGEAALTALTEAPAARAGLAEAIVAGMLSEDDRGLVSFRHALVGQAVYQAIPPPDQRALHARLGLALESSAPLPVAQLARHFRRADDATRWCRYAEQAADLAVASGDEATAVTLLHDLITNAALPAPAVLRLMHKIPSLPVTGFDRCRELVDALRLVLSRPPLPDSQEAELRMQLGRLLIQLEDYDAARSELERAVPEMPAGSAAAARAMILLGGSPAGHWSRAASLRWLRQAREVIAATPDPGRLSLTVEMITGLLRLGAEEGWAYATELPAEGSTAAEWLQITRAHANIGDEAMRWGRYDVSRSRLARALELADAHEYGHLRDFIVGSQLRLRWLTGAWEGLTAQAAELAGHEDVHPGIRREATLVSGMLEMAAGDQARAEQQLRSVLEQARARGAVQFYVEPAAALAWLRLADGQAEEAVRLTDKPMGMITGQHIWIWATEIAPARIESLIATGRTSEAAALVAAFAAGLGRCDAPAAQAALVLCKAILAAGRGEHATAAALSDRAARAWQALPRPYDALLARERQARYLLAADSTQTAQQAMTQAFNGLAGLGARRDADRLMRSLRDHGVEVERPLRWGGRRGYGNQLSPREAEVVRLVIAGHTNREIAAALCRSQDTVATQLKSAMRKLRVSSRTALAATAAGAGIRAGVHPEREGERSASAS
jgi:DNA-binding NarL/FixJ family response regulator